MKKHLIISAIVILLLLVGLSGCLVKDINGKWKSDRIMVLFENGKFKQNFDYDVEPPFNWEFEGTYDYNGSTLTLYYEYVTAKNETISDIKDIYSVDWVSENSIKFTIKSYSGWEVLGINETFWKD